LSVRKLAAAAKVSPETVLRFEGGERIRNRTIDSLRQVLEAAGLEFTDGRKPGVRLRKRRCRQESRGFDRLLLMHGFPNASAASGAARAHASMDDNRNIPRSKRRDDIHSTRRDSHNICKADNRSRNTHNVGQS
jgi:transcriptional regulator with XRE-family HTH domain